MTQPLRLATGGLIDRAQRIAFTFNGQKLEGCAGDTLASALVANGVQLIGRSFKYHRPRGLVAAGAEEPNGLVQLGTGAGTEPNLRATQIVLRDGLVAASQNCWPSVGFDLQAVNNIFSRFLPAGFYYKTFMWPASLWLTYEHVIRHAAGMGKSAREPDPDRYAHHHAHCDVLVVGGGPAGLAAALSAGRAGARVILVEQDFRLGGALLHERADIAGEPALNWVDAAVAELAALPEVTLLASTTAFGYFDQNFLGLLEHTHATDRLAPRQRLWNVRAKEVVLATGALERPMPFANNDIPGIMLAGAARAYANRYGARAGKRAVVFANNDSAYAAALDLHASGIEIAAIIDVREGSFGYAVQQAARAGLPVRFNHAVVRAHGRRRVTGVDVAGIASSSRAERIACDLVLTSGGWNPAVHLHTQAKGKLRFDDALAAFVPDTATQRVRSAGAGRGTFTLAEGLAEGFAAGAEAARMAGYGEVPVPTTPDTSPDHSAPLKAYWLPHAAVTRGEKCFLDFQNDVTVADLRLAAREGYTSVEHVKRYTTLGMGTDQGKLSNISGLGVLSDVLGATIPAIGTTTFRAPYTPITFGAMAGTETGERMAPVRRSAMHEWHQQAGAPFVTAGLWLRAQMYPNRHEADLACINRETNAVRGGVGIVDVSTLGKIDLQGPDAAEFLERVYANRWKSLAVGKLRYGVMLREDGMVFDDGTTTRIADQRYLMTTTTANAVRVMSHLEYCLQVLWPTLDVYCTSVTDHWAALALAGPKSRAVLEKLAPTEDWSNAALPHMSYRAATLAGIPARVFRLSFSGEISYEINVAADHGEAMWRATLDAGYEHGITPYGTEAMGVLRIEKGHVAGNELDGRTTADDLGLGRMVKTDRDFIGRTALTRPLLTAPDRKQLVGVVPLDGKTAIPRGAQLIVDLDRVAPLPIDGHVTSTCYSPTLGQPIALALLKGGRERHGEVLWAYAPVADVQLQVRVTDPVFVDPAGERVRG